MYATNKHCVVMVLSIVLLNVGYEHQPLQKIMNICQGTQFI